MKTGSQLGDEAPDRRRDDHFDLPKNRLAKLISQREFFHDMALRDGVRTQSRVYGDKFPPNYHLWPVLKYLSEIDLAGKRCLDIGTLDGMTAFVLSELGAGEIVATCQQDLNRFRMVRAYQGYENIDYRPNISIAEFPAIFEPASFDLVVISAMLHHLTAPLDALLEARRLLNRGGLFVIESIEIERDDPALLLNTELEEPVFGAPTLFVPTEAAMRGMLKLACFDILSETRLLGGREARETNHERITFLGRAARPSEINGRNRKTTEIHEKSPKIGASNIQTWEDDMSPSSEIAYRGEPGARAMNIWLDRCDLPLCPPAKPDCLLSSTRFSVGLETEFLSLARKYPDDAFTWKDVHLLGVRYPGETMPEGMSWGLKQLGNLHVLDYVRRLGLSKILEIGPGFNLYFPNHLPVWCDYTGLDAPGFYPDHMLDLANAARTKGTFEEGVLGIDRNSLPSSAFDACISISVLEHVPSADVPSVCADMYRVLKPGGWAIHSIDMSTHALREAFDLWLSEFAKAGFLVDPARVAAPTPPAPGVPDRTMYEPLSIRARFHGRYQETIWKKGPAAKGASVNNGQSATILAAALKPRESEDREELNR